MQNLKMPSRGFLITLVVVGLAAIVAKPTARWTMAKYDMYKAKSTVLTASDPEYRQLLGIIKTQQPDQTLNQAVPAEFATSEKIFQAAIAPDLLGRSSRYEPYTSSGQLACAAMVNKVIQKALNYQIGKNTIYVPSIVESLDAGDAKRLLQAQTRRGDIAIANGTNYEKGLWHIGICASDKCTLVLSNSPESRRFDWLSNANFDGAFDHFPGKTTFYRISNRSPS